MKRLFTLLIIFTTILIQAEPLKGKDYGAVTVTEVTSIHSGNIFTVNIKNYPELIGSHITILINGIDIPEIKGKCQKEIDLAHEAKQYTVSMLSEAKTIELRNMKRGKEFRIIADVYADGKSLAEELMKNKLGVYNDGVKQKDWCALESPSIQPTVTRPETFTVTVIANGQKHLIDNNEVIRKTILSELKKVVWPKISNNTTDRSNKVEFTLLSSGDLRWLTLKNDSGEEVLDNISLEVIKLSSSRFPPPSRPIIVQVEFTYHVQ